jgi:hypothetical protein
MTRTWMLTLAAAGLLVSGCGQQASDAPTQAPEGLVGCTQTQSKAAARDASEVPAEVDLDGDGSPEKVLITRDDAACPGVLFTTVKDRRYSAKVRDLAGLDLTSATRVSLPGREGDLLALRAEHPRGGFQVQVYALDDALGEVTAAGQPVVPFVATDTTGGYLSVTCADDALVVRQAVVHEPPGIVFAWDVKETRYAVDGLRATRGATTEVADNILDQQLGKEFPDVKHRRMFAKGCSA